MDPLTAFEDHLEKCFSKLDLICEKLSEVHSKNMRKLQLSYDNSIEKLYRYKCTLSEIILSIKNTSKNFYPKIEEIRNSGKNLMEYEKKFFLFKDLEFSEIEDEIYEFQEFKVFDSWKPVTVEACSHDQRRIIVTYCKKPHCNECLSDLIDKKSFKCPCDTGLSLKDYHQVKGDSTNYKEIYKKLQH